MSDSVGAQVRRLESEYIRGNAQLSKYVNFSMVETLDRIAAYLSSKHISGEFDSLGREKPFFNICVAAANIWFRATDINTSQIKIRATKSKDWLDSFLATIKLQEWMRKEQFASFLNEWGRVLSRYGSAVVKFVENSSGLHIHVTPWTTLIVDPIDMENNPVIEVLELTEAQLYMRVQTNGYDAAQVKLLCDAVRVRETVEKRRKDNRIGYIKLYEIHGNLSKAQYNAGKGIEVKKGDDDIFFQQVHVISYVGKKGSRGKEYQDFTLYCGKEDKSPYMLTHLLKEDDRTLSIGAVEYIFDAQWMVNHAKKTEKDTLDIASRLILQTADSRFVGKNVLENIESGDILVHSAGNYMNLTKVEMSKPELQQLESNSQGWQALAKEITGTPDALRGISSGSSVSAYRAQALQAQQAQTLFTMMTQNKGLSVIDMMTGRVLPYIKKTDLNNAKEIAATLDSHDIQRIDSAYIKSEAVKRTNKQVLGKIGENIDRIGKGQPLQPIDVGAMMQQNTADVQDSMTSLGGQRFFKPSEISSKTWAKQFKDLEWEFNIDVTGESEDIQDKLTSINNALAMVLQPGFETNKRAQALVARTLELTGAMSPVEYYSIPASPSAPPATALNIPSTTATGGGLQNSEVATK